MPTRERTELTWRKSSYSNGDNGDCVEVATAPGAAAVRDSKSPASGHLTVPAHSWRTFLSRLS
ncbi:MAG: hypothetical protein JWQ81_4394 [Amycolatopsis sp.]|jgi:hypothetical protein|uniref:DUF397 domain-containing protein n=1 Tax=Amycolatopsis sp. TaxID=37632 RepID=UPI0026119919|nr:DUF397 domain-containing protein [Amycolatopsis sp.]MCU1683655.1 hypothetical protein [Amycolatopsis sp.]